MTEDNNEIKKTLYRGKPYARLIHIDKSGITYAAEVAENKTYFFQIPFTDIGDGKFYNEMEAQQLIRWLIIPL